MSPAESHLAELFSCRGLNIAPTAAHKTAERTLSGCLRIIKQKSRSLSLESSMSLVLLAKMELRPQLQKVLNLGPKECH